MVNSVNNDSRGDPRLPARGLRPAARARPVPPFAGPPRDKHVFVVGADRSVCPLRRDHSVCPLRRDHSVCLIEDE